MSDHVPLYGYLPRTHGIIGGGKDNDGIISASRSIKSSSTSDPGEFVAPLVSAPARPDFFEFAVNVGLLR